MRIIEAHHQTKTVNNKATNFVDLYNMKVFD